MYGYASELLPYIQSLLSAPANAAPLEPVAPSAPMALSGAAPMPPRRPRAMANNVSAPVPPRRPAGLLGVSAPSSTGDSTDNFLRSQGIGVAPSAAMPMPRIDSGPTAPAPQNPTWQMPQYVNAPLPPARPAGLGQPAISPDQLAWLHSQLYGK